MKCHECGKHIDLELSSKQSKEFEKEMEDAGIIALCTDCYIVPEDINGRVNRRTVSIDVPVKMPDPNWREWDYETFYLREHLLELIKAYGQELVSRELADIGVVNNGHNTF